MDAKDFLERPWKLLGLLNDAKRKVTMLKAMAERGHAAYGPEAEVVSHSRNTNLLQDTVIRLAEAREEEARLHGEYIDAVLETGLVINRVQDPVARMVLEKRYLEFMTIVEIAKGADHSERWGRMRHAEGLRAVREILDSDGAGGV